MHRPVTDNLEEYLRKAAGQLGNSVPREMEAHLAGCGECSRELKRLEEDSTALRSLRAPAGLEPRAGFYARVMQRIEDARASNSVWSAFLEPLFAKRLAFASFAMMVLLGTYLITTEPGNPAGPSPAAVALSTQGTASATDETPSTQERDAVLVDLAAYHQ